MDLIPRQQKNSPLQDLGLKSRGISISDKESSYAFLFSKWILVSLSALAMGFIVFGGIKGYDFYLQRTIQDYEQQIEAAQSNQDPDMIQKVLDLDKSMNIVEGLLASHIYSSYFFQRLEQLTLPQVQWTGSSLDAVKGVAQLKGKAASYSFLAKQIVSFQDAKFEITTSGISLARDGVEFSALIKFDPAILKNK